MRRRLAPALLLPATLAALAGSGCGLLAPRPEGERLWRSLCAECHGLDGRGNTPRYMSNPYADLTDDTWHDGSGDRAGLESVIRQGVLGEMEPHDELTPEQMRALIDYIYKLRGERE